MKLWREKYCLSKMQGIGFKILNLVKSLIISNQIGLLLLYLEWFL